MERDYKSMDTLGAIGADQQVNSEGNSAARVDVVDLMAGANVGDLGTFGRPEVLSTVGYGELAGYDNPEEIR